MSNSIHFMVPGNGIFRRADLIRVTPRVGVDYDLLIDSPTSPEDDFTFNLVRVTQAQTESLFEDGEDTRTVNDEVNTVKVPCVKVVSLEALLELISNPKIKDQINLRIKNFKKDLEAQNDFENHVAELRASNPENLEALLATLNAAAPDTSKQEERVAYIGKHLSLAVASVQSGNLEEEEEENTPKKGKKAPVKEESEVEPHPIFSVFEDDNHELTAVELVLNQYNGFLNGEIGRINYSGAFEDADDEEEGDDEGTVIDEDRLLSDDQVAANIARVLGSDTTIRNDVEGDEDDSETITEDHDEEGTEESDED